MLIVYIISLLICLFGVFMASYTDNDDSAVLFGLFTFIPAINTVIAILLIGELIFTLGKHYGKN